MDGQCAREWTEVILYYDTRKTIQEGVPRN